MLGFCLDKSLIAFEPGVKPKDQYDSIQIDPEADLPMDYISAKLAYYTGRIDKG